MKKLLSVVLILILSVMCFALASCSDEVSTDDVEENTQKVLAEAMENTNNKFFAAEESDSAYAAMTQAIESGAIAISLEGDEILGMLFEGMDVSKISETIYFDSANGKLVSDTGIVMGEEELGALIFVDKTGIKVSSESLLGDNTTYALNLDTFIDKFADSYLGQMAGLPEGAFDQYKESLEAFKTEYEKLLTETEIKADSFGNTLLKKLNPSVTESSVTVGGEDIDCVVITYSLTNSTIEALAGAVVDELVELANLSNDEKTMMESTIDEALAEITDKATINCKYEYYLNTADNTIAKIALTGSITVKVPDYESDEYAQAASEYYSDENYEYYDSVEEYAEYNDIVIPTVENVVSVNMTQTFTATEQKTTQTMTMDGEEITSDVTIKRTDDGDKVTYSIVSNGTEINEDGEAESIKVLDLKATYTKSSGDVSVKITIPAETMNSEEDQTVELKGKLNLDNGAKFTFTSVKMGAYSVEFELIVDFQKSATMPNASNVKDVVDLTQGNIVDLMTAIQEGPLGAYIGNDVAGEAVPNAYPDDAAYALEEAGYSVTQTTEDGVTTVTGLSSGLSDMVSIAYCTSEAEAQAMYDELAQMGLEEMGYEYGIDGTMVWFGTPDAIEASAN